MKETGAGGGAGARAPAPARGGAGSDAAPAGESTGGGALYYRYRSDDGRVVIVDSLSRVPPRARSGAERIALDAAPSSVSVLPGAISSELHWPSFAAGGGSALLVCAVLFFALRARTLLVRLVLLAGLVALSTGAYLGWVRRTTGQTGALLESPAALIDDARTAVEKMNARAREQERALRELEAER